MRLRSLDVLKNKYNPQMDIHTMHGIQDKPYNEIL